ncbi:substrate-binding domain-containing protein [Tautonia plasticadhaerens]|uniref:Arabinose metabolism transcriptional repressor n=1 Tax=Tautonia plasticadhaerens TaxID=2527974 RepID=A0A518HBJ7_9BACT|nr:GntR family transcriptional regulator [Tautonia plasticadhaerens]QDV38221.1 Arabinose metabolism transcriptional repressor [Tautonia plasticadhaerens]
MPAEPKYRRIVVELLAEIASGKYSPSGRLPSEAQLVARFGVSRPTVARALHDLQEQGLIERRVGSGSYLSRRPTAGPGDSVRQLGLLIPGLGTTEIFEAICGELAGLARVHGYGLLWGGTGPRPPADLGAEDAEALCEQFIAARVAGVFFAPFERNARSEELNLGLAEKLRRAGIALVLLDRDLGPFPTRSDLDLVGVDNFAGGYLLAEHLLKLGCRSLAFAIRPMMAPTANARIAGAREAILARGLPVPPGFVHVGEPDAPEFARGLLDGGRTDAILCANDDVAAVLLRTIDRLGVLAPAGVRVVGFDDVRFASLLSVPLTTMRQPCREIAVVALRAMLDRIADPTLPPRGLTLSPSLVVRESCGAYLGRAGG